MKFLQLLRRKALDTEGEVETEALVELEGSPPFVVGYASDRGKVRERNEDAYFVFTSALCQEEGNPLALGLFVVADGVGGHRGGRMASTMTVRLVVEHLFRTVYLPFLGRGSAELLQAPIQEALKEAVQKANTAVYEASAEAGTTVTCALMLGNNAYVAHVGDTRAYLIERRNIRLITRDHSLVGRLVEMGQLSEEEAMTHPQRNVLYRAVGKAGSIEVDTYLRSVPNQAYLLLCSDGLWGVVPEEEIVSIVHTAPTPHVACQRLVRRANELGGEDNITAVLVRVVA